MMSYQQSEDSSLSTWTVETAIASLNASQLTFLCARLWVKTDKAAAQQIGIKPSTVYGWDREAKEAIRWLLHYHTTNAIQISTELLTRSLLKATLVKISALDDESESVKQDAATEILDRVIGKPRQAVDVTTNQPAMKTYVNVSPDMWDQE